MGMQALMIFQIIADIVLCIAILFLLMRIGRNIGRAKPPVLDDTSLAELGRLIQESRAEAEHFSRIMDESCAKLKNLALHLETQEAKLAEHRQEVNRQLEQSRLPDGVHDSNKYTKVSALLKTGLTVKEVVQQTGLTEGEISLIFELEKKKIGP